MTFMARVTRQERDAPPLRTATLQRLERLAGTLTQRGLEASLADPLGRVPRLQVGHPAARLAIDVYVWRGQDGAWWFWWPWAERIAADGDLDTAAERIERLLSQPAGD
jgi:hypothetical protein